MLNIIYILFISLFIPGIINRTRALCSGRKGIPILKHLSNIIVLFNKSSVYGSSSGLLFRLAPTISLAAVLAALLMIPFGHRGAIISFEGDFVIVFYLFAITRFLTILGALSTSSSFEGMGASREALYGALVEPAIFTTIASLSLITGYTSFSQIYLELTAARIEMVIAIILLYYVLMKICITETGHVPIDDPRTHLELTMIHEVMILDYSGVDLAFIHISNWIKAGIFAVLASGALSSSFELNQLMTILFSILMAVIIGVIESFMARNKLSKNATYIASITAITLMAFAICYLIKNNIHITL